MFRLDETVKIKKSGVIGTITDISGNGSNVVYVIDTDTGDDENDFGGMSAVYYCRPDEIEKV